METIFRNITLILHKNKPMIKWISYVLVVKFGVEVLIECSCFASEDPMNIVSGIFVACI